MIQCISVLAWLVCLMATDAQSSEKRCEQTPRVVVQTPASHSVFLAANDRYAALGIEPSGIEIHCLESGRLVWVVRDPRAVAADFWPHREALVFSGSDDRGAVLLELNLRTGEQIPLYYGNTSALRMAFNDDGSRLAILSSGSNRSAQPHKFHTHLMFFDTEHKPASFAYRMETPVSWDAVLAWDGHMFHVEGFGHKCRRYWSIGNQWMTEVNTRNGIDRTVQGLPGEGWKSNGNEFISPMIGAEFAAQSSIYEAIMARRHTAEMTARMVTRATTARLAQVTPDSVSVWNGPVILTLNSDGNIQARQHDQRTAPVKLEGHGPSAIVFGENIKIDVIDRQGVTDIRRVINDELIAQLLPVWTTDGDPGWIAWAPDGYWDASSGAEDLVEIFIGLAPLHRDGVMARRAGKLIRERIAEAARPHTE